MSITGTTQRPQRGASAVPSQTPIEKLIAEACDPVVAELLRSMPPIELLKILPFKSAGTSGETVESATGLSRDSVQRHYSHWIVRMSPRRCGVRRIHAIMMGAAKA